MNKNTNGQLTFEMMISAEAGALYKFELFISMPIIIN